jgi:hypothetical protein
MKVLFVSLMVFMIILKMIINYHLNLFCYVYLLNMEELFPNYPD